MGFARKACLVQCFKNILYHLAVGAVGKNQGAIFGYLEVSYLVGKTWCSKILDFPALQCLADYLHHFLAAVTADVVLYFHFRDLLCVNHIFW